MWKAVGSHVEERKWCIDLKMSAVRLLRISPRSNWEMNPFHQSYTEERRWMGLTQRLAVTPLIWASYRNDPAPAPCGFLCGRDVPSPITFHASSTMNITTRDHCFSCFRLSSCDYICPLDVGFLVADTLRAKQMCLITRNSVWTLPSVSHCGFLLSD